MPSFWTTICKTVRHLPWDRRLKPFGHK